MSGKCAGYSVYFYCTPFKRRGTPHLYKHNVIGRRRDARRVSLCLRFLCPTDCIVMSKQTALADLQAVQKHRADYKSARVVYEL